MLKKILERYLILFLIVVLYSCQNDDYISNKTTYSDIIIDIKETSVYKLNKDKELKKEYYKLLNDQTDNSSLLKTSISYRNRDIILTDTLVKIANFNDIISYTFSIQNTSENPNAFQNLILNKKIGEDFKYYIATYIPSEEPKLVHSNEYSFVGTKTFEEINSNINFRVNNNGCNTTYIKWCKNDGYGGIGPVHIAGENCKNDNLTWTEAFVWGCEEEQEDESLTPLDPGGGNSGGGNSGGGSDNTIITAPIISQIDHIEVLNRLTKFSLIGENIFRNKIDEYVGLLDTAQEEDGVMFVRGFNNTYNLLFPSEKGFNFIYFPHTPSATEVIMHYHHNFVNDQGDILLPIPSESDIFSFAKSFYQMGRISSRDNLSFILVTKTGLHALRVKDPQKVSDFFQYLNTDINVTINGITYKKGKDLIKFLFKRNVIIKTINECNNICTPEELEEVRQNNFSKWLRDELGIGYYYTPHPENPDDDYIWTKQN